MLTYQHYVLLHVLGIVLVFMALGAFAFHGANGGTKDSNKTRGLLMGTHGVGMLLIVVAGFGMLARTGGMAGGLPAWLHPKLLIWLLLGAAPVALARKPEWGKLMWIVLPVLAATAGYFGLNHSSDHDGAAATEPAAKSEAKIE